MAEKAATGSKSGPGGSNPGLESQSSSSDAPETGSWKETCQNLVKWCRGLRVRRFVEQKASEYHFEVLGEAATGKLFDALKRM